MAAPAETIDQIRTTVIDLALKFGPKMLAAQVNLAPPPSPQPSHGRARRNHRSDPYHRHRPGTEIRPEDAGRAGHPGARLPGRTPGGTLARARADASGEGAAGAQPDSADRAGRN